MSAFDSSYVMIFLAGSKILSKYEINTHKMYMMTATDHMSLPGWTRSNSKISGAKQT